MGESRASGTLTFLFTDVEGHTPLWRTRPDEMRVALQRHDEIVRSLIADYRGEVFTTAGDSFAAAFTTADAALEAAIAIQEALTAETWPERTEIRVRIGLHTGVAEARDHDYFGPAVILAERIQSVGHGGQILLSASTAALVDRPDVLPVGAHMLAGFDRPSEVYQIGAHEFPPLRTPTRRRHNLGRAQPSLLGRADEVDRLVALARARRVVTITGAGGIGKTSLALAVARQLVDDGDGEVWWCDLVSAAAADVPFRVGQAAGLRSGSNDAVEVARFLARREATWLVLDNCEHVLDAVAETAGALLEETTVRTIVTSRVPLEISDEVVIALGPLGVADEAVDLFIRHATRLDPESTVSSQRDEIERLCRRVDGLPLAVELVAAHTRVLSLADIEQRLDRLLDSSRRRSTDRHRTMASTIEWSLAQLDEGRSRALGRLAVFAGGFDLQAAEAILTSSVDDDPMVIVEELAAHSLLEVQGATASDGGARRMRYRLLEPIRQYSAAQLWRDPNATRDAHLEHYLERLEFAYRQLGSTGCDAMLELLQHDVDNLGAVHDWALRSGRLDDDLRLYRPLMIADAHGVLQPGEWATETLRRGGVENHDRWREALAKAFQTVEFKLGWTSSAESTGLLDRLESAGPGPGSDLVEAELAWIEGTRGRRFADSVGRWDAIDSTDPFVIYLRYLLSWLPRGRLSSDPRATAAAELARGRAWARSIGALNFEAAMASQAATAELMFGEPQLAGDLADEAIDLTAAVRMDHMCHLAVLARAHAVLLGAKSADDPVFATLTVLRSAVQGGVGVRLVMALATAARVLLAADCVAQAALAYVGAEPVTRGSIYRLDGLRGEVLEAAREQVDAEGLDEWDIAVRTIEQLEQLLAGGNDSPPT